MAARILLVDDHESVRRGVRNLFANNDSFEVCGEAQNGTDAIRMVADLSPDVVILDLTMPGMTGFQTAAKIREIAPSIRIIFFTIHDIPPSAWWVRTPAYRSLRPGRTYAHGQSCITIAWKVSILVGKA